MEDIIEYSPQITDTPEERAQLVKDIQEQTKALSSFDDFIVFPKEETLNESTQIINLGKVPMEFTYLTSFKAKNELYSFGESNGYWYYFKRTGFDSGNELHGPYKTKIDVARAMEKLYA